MKPLTKKEKRARIRLEMPKIIKIAKRNNWEYWQFQPYAIKVNNCIDIYPGAHRYYDLRVKKNGLGTWHYYEDISFLENLFT